MNYDPDFFAECPMVMDLMQTFEFLPRVVFYAKDVESRFVAGNQAMLEAKKLSSFDQLSGTTDADYHPLALAAEYVAEDQRVMNSGKAIGNQIWYVMDQHGHPGWFNSSKVPLRGIDGKVAGIAGVRFPVESPAVQQGRFRKLEPALKVLEKRHREQISMTELADRVGMSSTHFNRQFAELLGISPTRLLHAMRLDRSRQLLTTTDMTIGQIAVEVGYFDQSHFTRRFRQYCGVTPRAYRKRFRG